MTIDMKKIILMLAAVFTFSAAAMAQEAKEGTNDGQKVSREEMIQNRTDRVVKRYGLNAEQAKQLLELNTAYADKMPMRGPRRGGPNRQMNQNRQQSTDGQTGATTQQQRQRPSREQIEARRKEMQANMESYNYKLKKIMTEEQYTQYTNDMKNFRSRGPRGPRGGRGEAQNQSGN